MWKRQAKMNHVQGQHRVIAVLRSSDARRLQARIGQFYPLRCEVNVGHAVDAIEADVGGVVLVDPEIVNLESRDAILRAAVGVGAKIVAYLSCTRDSYRLLLDCMAIASVEVVLRGTDDEAFLIKQQLESGQDVRPRARVLAGLSERLRTLPTDLGYAVSSMFVARPVPMSPRALMARCSRSRRSCERDLALAGLEAARRLISGAHVVWAWDDLQRRSQTLGEIAARCGLDSDVRLIMAFKSVVGFPPRRACRDLKEVQLAERVTRALTRGL